MAVATDTRVDGRGAIPSARPSDAPWVDALRALAALTIVGFHVVRRPGGDSDLSGFAGSVASHLNVGVPIFFVLSGYLLYRPFLAARAAGRTPNTRTFLRNRFLRIFPAYWVALALLTVAGLVSVTPSLMLFDVTLTQVWFVSDGTDGLPVAWTLCNEIVFYLVLPWLAAYFSARSLRRTRLTELQVLLAAMLVVIAARVVVTWLALQGHASIGAALGTPLLNADLFAAGMCLALVERDGPPTPLRHPRRSLWPLAAVLFLALALIQPEPLHATQAQLLAEHVLHIAIASLLIAPAALHRGPQRRPSSIGAMLAWLGLVSYGIYLWHLPLIDWLRPHLHGELPYPLYALACVIVAVAAGAASFYAVERHVLRRKRSA